MPELEKFETRLHKTRLILTMSEKQNTRAERIAYYPAVCPCDQVGEIDDGHENSVYLVSC